MSHQPVKTVRIHEGQISRYSFSRELYLTQKANGIKYLYASLDIHPDDYGGVSAVILRLKGSMLYCLRNLHDLGRIDQVSGYLAVALARLGAPGGMVMDENKRNGIVFQGALHHLTG